MTRSNAREIAVQLVFSLGFGDDSAQGLLDGQLTPEEKNAISHRGRALEKFQAELKSYLSSR